MRNRNTIVQTMPKGRYYIFPDSASPVLGLDGTGTMEDIEAMIARESSPETSTCNEPFTPKQLERLNQVCSNVGQRILSGLVTY